jgi:hypothetical protein
LVQEKVNETSRSNNIRVFCLMIEVEEDNI